MYPRSRRVRARLLATAAAGLVLASLWLAGSAPSRTAPREEWAWLVEAGDTLAATRRTVLLDGTALTARSAYLLAFHHAQDRGDVGRMLVAAARLEEVGEPALARHARQVAAAVAADGIARSAAPSGARPAP